MAILIHYSLPFIGSPYDPRTTIVNQLKANRDAMLRCINHDIHYSDRELKNGYLKDAA